MGRSPTCKSEARSYLGVPSPREPQRLSPRTCAGLVDQDKLLHLHFNPDVKYTFIHDIPMTMVRKQRGIRSTNTTHVPTDRRRPIRRLPPSLRSAPGKQQRRDDGLTFITCSNCEVNTDGRVVDTIPFTESIVQCMRAVEVNRARSLVKVFW